MSMTPLVLIGIAIGLSMDAFAVAVACSLSLGKVSPRQVFRIAFHFGLFQALMPIIGWIIGQGAFEYIADWDHWVAFILLSFVGGKAIFESFLGNDEACSEINDPTRGLTLIIYSISTSVDALAVGLSLAMIGISIIIPAVVIGLITAFLSAVGMLIGGKIGERYGARLEMAGGLILIGIGLKILLGHLLE